MAGWLTVASLLISWLAVSVFAEGPGQDRTAGTQVASIAIVRQPDMPLRLQDVTLRRSEQGWRIGWTVQNPLEEPVTQITGMLLSYSPTGERKRVETVTVLDSVVLEPGTTRESVSECPIEWFDAADHVRAAIAATQGEATAFSATDLPGRADEEIQSALVSPPVTVVDAPSDAPARITGVGLVPNSARPLAIFYELHNTAAGYVSWEEVWVYFFDRKGVVRHVSTVGRLVSLPKGASALRELVVNPAAQAVWNKVGTGVHMVVVLTGVTTERGPWKNDNAHRDAVAAGQPRMGQ